MPQFELATRRALGYNRPVMTNDEVQSGAHDATEAIRAFISAGREAGPRPLLCCGVAPTLRRVEFSVAFTCRLCARMAEPAKSELSAVMKWNRDLEASLGG